MTQHPLCENWHHATLSPDVVRFAMCLTMVGASSGCIELTTVVVVVSNPRCVHMLVCLEQSLTSSLR